MGSTPMHIHNRLSSSSDSPHQRFSDPADRSSFSPDMAREIDSDADDLVEVFLATLRAMPPSALPATWLEFQGSVRDIMARAVVDPDGLGGAIEELRARDASAAAQEAVMQTLAIVLDNPDSRKLAADAITFAAGLHGLQDGRSQTDLAAANDVGRAAVSKRVTAAQRSLGLPPSRGMKDEQAQLAYQRRAHSQHGTEYQETAKECRLMLTAIKRLTAWLVRILPDLQAAADGKASAAMLAEAIPALCDALQCVMAV